MNNKNQLLLVTLTLFAMTSFGFSPQKSALRLVEKARHTKLAQTKSAPKITTCADLAGTWDGDCIKDDGTSEKSKIKITQSQCMSLKVKTLIPYEEDAIDISVDMTGVGVTNYSTSSALASVGASVAGRWNTDGTIAQIEMIALVNSPFLTAPQTMKQSSQLLLDGSALVQFMKGEGFLENSGDRTCKYLKIN